MAEEEQLTESEKEEVRDILGYGTPIPEGKNNVHTFLHNVATAEDTTKLGYLKDEEIGKLENPVRSFKFMALFADKIMNKPELSKFFNQRSEIATSTSLSRDAMLLKLAVTQKKELADITAKPRKENKGWFGKDKNKGGEVENAA